MKFKIPYSFDWTYGVSINKIREDLDAVEKLGATHIDIEHGIDYDCSYIEIESISERIETNDELQERINEFNKRQEMVKQRELAQLESIKAKYGLK